jgi:hypothetical protein
LAIYDGLPPFTAVNGYKNTDYDVQEFVLKDGRLYLKLQVTRSARLLSSIMRGRIEDIGKIKPMIRMIDLNADRKRFWLGTLMSVDERVCNDSVPISLNHFAKRLV